MALGPFVFAQVVFAQLAFAQEWPVVALAQAPLEPADPDQAVPDPPVTETNADSSETVAAQAPTPELSQEAVPKRLFGIIPNYRADQTRLNYQPLTAAGKFRIARKDSFDWPNFFLLSGYAFQAQVAHGGFAHNGGYAGFGEYYARAFGDGIISNYLTEAILPAMLHEDPRFFRLGTGTFRHRTAYVASRVFVTRKDNGSTGFNVSEVAGNVGVVLATSLYYPNSLALDECAERYGIQLGNDLIANMLTEFWPDLKRHLRIHH